MSLHYVADDNNDADDDDDILFSELIQDGRTNFRINDRKRVQ
jgi:hypothetical protein